jgi:Domain of unknown function (DUF4919)
MKSLLAALMLVASLITASAQTPKQPSNQPTEQAPHQYVQLVERAKKGDSTVSFKELRRVFGDWQCQKHSDAPDRQAMVDAFEKKDYAKAVELVEGVLDYEYVHRGMHLAAEDAYRHLGNTTKADEHKAVAEKLLDALLTSGDGKSAKTAFFVLSIREEYFIMSQLGYKPSSQALVSEGDRMFDVLSGTDSKTGNQVSLYFDITNFFGGCDSKPKPKP